MALSVTINGDDTVVRVSVVDRQVALQFNDDDEAYYLTKDEADTLAKLIQTLIYKE
jgi:hypothetical protein